MLIVSVFVWMCENDSNTGTFVTRTRFFENGDKNLPLSIKGTLRDYDGDGKGTGTSITQEDL